MKKQGVWLFGIFLVGCAVGPDFQRPEKPKSTRYTSSPMPSRTASSPTKVGRAQVFKIGEYLPKKWWTLFHSEDLNQLVEASLHANPDMSAARQALKIAHANTRTQQTAFFPLVTSNYNPSRQLTAGTLASNLSSNAYLYSLNTLNFNVTYMPDVLGFTRRQVEAAQAQEESLAYQCQAIYLTLASNIVLAAIQEAEIREQMNVTQTSIRLARDLFKRYQQQWRMGAVSQAEVVAQAAYLAQIESAMPPLQQQLATQRHLLASLRGVSPSAQLPMVFTLNHFTLPKELPVKLPSQLVRQRPDVRAAEADLHAASARVGVAIANRFPNIMLSASGGLMPVSFSDASIPSFLPLLPTGGAKYWYLGGNFLGTLFDAGALMYQQEAAKSAYRMAQAQYRRVVLNAFQNVADALKAIEYDAYMLKLAAKQAQASAKNVDIMQHKLALGLASHVEVIQAEQLYQQALANVAQSQGERLSDTVGLFQALGGGTLPSHH